MKSMPISHFTWLHFPLQSTPTRFRLTIYSKKTCEDPSGEFQGLVFCLFVDAFGNLAFLQFKLDNVALSRNSTGGLFYGPFAGFTAFSIFAALASVGAASSPDLRMATATSMRLCPIRSE